MFRPPQPLLPGRWSAIAASALLVGLTAQQAHSVGEHLGRVPDSEFAKVARAFTEAGYGEMVRLPSILVGLSVLQDQIQQIVSACHRTAWIFDRVAEVATTKVPTASWRLESASALFELLNVEREGINDITWAVAEQPQLVTRLVRFGMQSPQLNAPQVAADSRVAADLIRSDPIRNFSLLSLPATPQTSDVPTWPEPTTAELLWLKECAASPSVWLAGLGVSLISQITDADGHELLRRDIVDVNVQIRQRVAFLVLANVDRDALWRSWFTHPDPLVRVASAQALAQQELDTSEVRELANATDLAIGLSTLQGLAESGSDAFEAAAAMVLESSPTEWTCSRCGKAQPMDNNDCSNCTSGYQPDLLEEIDQFRMARQNGPD